MTGQSPTSCLCVLCGVRKSDENCVREWRGYSQKSISISLFSCFLLTVEKSEAHNHFSLIGKRQKYIHTTEFSMIFTFTPELKTRLVIASSMWAAVGGEGKRPILGFKYVLRGIKNYLKLLTTFRKRKAFWDRPEGQFHCWCHQSNNLKCSYTRKHQFQ